MRQDGNSQMQRDETSDVEPFEGIEDDENQGTRETTGTIRHSLNADDGMELTHIPCVVWVQEP